MKGIVQEEDIVNGRDDAKGGHYIREGWCRRRAL